jgi:hypothetical protein
MGRGCQNRCGNAILGGGKTAQKRVVQGRLHRPLPQICAARLRAMAKLRPAPLLRKITVEKKWFGHRSHIGVLVGAARLRAFRWKRRN